jgi:hypothetical protein
MHGTHHYSVESLKTSKFVENSYDKQVEFLCTVKKPRDLEPAICNALLSFHNSMLAQLPVAPQDAANAVFSFTEM